MRINRVEITDFKNLKDFKIELDQSQMNTILLGQNATGKSNFIEALILIFKYLDLKKLPKGTDNFDYNIEYVCRNRRINIKLRNRSHLFQVDGKKITKTQFNRNKEYLPKYVFTYYSGLSSRLHRMFWDHQKRFYDNIKEKDFDRENLDDLRRLFYVQPVHSFFVLLAFYSFQQEEDQSREFLNEVFQIEDIESILFILNKPSWKGKGDNRFWGAEGLVKEFLRSIWECALAPIYHTEQVDIDFRRKAAKERLYLYISDKRKLKAFVDTYFRNLGTSPNNTNLFKALESTYISELLEETRIKVRKNIDGEITFRELSEGEQQLLTVLGLLKFTKDDESLILLDEPDTHLNPLWKWEYLERLNEVLGISADKENNTTQVIINTHDPLVIGSLEREQVRIFKRDTKTGLVTTETPDTNPKGLGVAGILTSDLFGLPTTLDSDTQDKIHRRDSLILKKQNSRLSKSEELDLAKKNEELDELGFNKIYRDPLYQKFRIALSKQQRYIKPELSEEEKQAQDEFAESILKELMEDEK